MEQNYNRHVRLTKTSLFTFGMDKSYLKKIFESDLSEVDMYALAFKVKPTDITLVKQIISRVKPQRFIYGYDFSPPKINSEELFKMLKEFFVEEYFKEILVWCNPQLEASFKIVESFQKITHPLKITIMAAAIRYTDKLSFLFKLVLNSQAKHDLIIQNEVPTLEVFKAFQNVNADSDLSNVKSIQFIPLSNSCHPKVLEPLYKKGVAMKTYIAFDTNIVMRKSALGLIEKYPTNSTFSSEMVEETSFPILPSVLDLFNVIKVQVTINVFNFTVNPYTCRIFIRSNATLLDVLAVASEKINVRLNSNRVRSQYQNYYIPWHSLPSTSIGLGGIAVFRKA